MLMFLEMKRNAHQVDTTTVHFRLRVEGEVWREGSGGVRVGEGWEAGWERDGRQGGAGRGGRGRALLYKKFTKGHLFPW